MKTETCINSAMEMFDSEDFRTSVFSEVKRLINSGALELSEEPEDSYALPKVVLTVALENTSNNYAPLYGGYKQTLRNLRKF